MRVISYRAFWCALFLATFEMWHRARSISASQWRKRSKQKQLNWKFKRNKETQTNTTHTNMRRPKVYQQDREFMIILFYFMWCFFFPFSIPPFSQCFIFRLIRFYFTTLYFYFFSAWLRLYPDNLIGSQRSVRLTKMKRNENNSPKYIRNGMLLSVGSIHAHEAHIKPINALLLPKKKQHKICFNWPMCGNSWIHDTTRLWRPKMALTRK